MSWAQDENLHYLIAGPSGPFDRDPRLRLLEMIVSDIELPRHE